MDTEELVRFIIQERVQAFYDKLRKEEPEAIREGRECHDAWERIMSRCSLQVKEEMEDYLNRLAEQQGKEMEEIYRFGLEDGIRLVQTVKRLFE